MQRALALIIIVFGIGLVLRRKEVRLVLGLCAAALFLVAGQLDRFLVVLCQEMANQKTVVPICSAMGFAYVLKHTGCDRHLVRLLVHPLSKARLLLIPGGIAVCFLVNTAIVSQSSTAATVGLVLIPLLRSTGVTGVTAGALLLLGSSMGGELCNPGAVEILTLAGLTGLAPQEVVRRVLPANLLAGITALGCFWLLSRRYEEGAAAPEGQTPEGPAHTERLSILRAAVPLLPLVLLFTVSPLIRLPTDNPGSALIAGAMLVGVVAAGLLTPREGGRLPGVFFEGAGFAYTNVISLIVTGTLFAEGIKANGLIEVLAGALTSRPVLATSASVALPGLLAGITGSGIAPAVAVMKVLVPIAATLGLDPVRLGACTAVAAQLGRTLSPAAAVVMMSATLSGVPLMELVRRVAPPLLAAALVLLLATLAGVL